jgi:hypothetical protein
VPHKWLSPRIGRWDGEELDQLAHLPPSLADLETEVFRDYVWLTDLTEQEAIFARADAGDRGAVIEVVRKLPRSAIPENANLY